VEELLARYRVLEKQYPRFDLLVLGEIERFGLRLPLVACVVQGGPRWALLLAGTHGDERAGPEALARFWEGPAAGYLLSTSFVFLPLINPIGYAKGIRTNGRVDLNRHFDVPPIQPENRLIVEFLQEKRVDLLISLHEDLTSSCFYMYESGVQERNLFARIVADDVALLNELEQLGYPVCNDEWADGNHNRGGLVLAGGRRRRSGRAGALEALMRVSGVARRVVGFETPGSLPFEDRVAIHLLALNHVLDSFLV